MIHFQVRNLLVLLVPFLFSEPCLTLGGFLDPMLDDQKRGPLKKNKTSWTKNLRNPSWTFWWHYCPTATVGESCESANGPRSRTFHPSSPQMWEGLASQQVCHQAFKDSVKRKWCVFQDVQHKFNYFYKDLCTWNCMFEIVWICTVHLWKCITYHWYSFQMHFK